MKAKAIVFPAERKAELTDVELPSPGDGDVVVAVETTGISVGTERWAYLGRRREMKFPFVTGYMSLGRIVEAGSLAKKAGYVPGGNIYAIGTRLPEPYSKHSWMSAHVSPAVVSVVGAYGAPSGVCVPAPDGLDPLEGSLAALTTVAMQGIEMAVIPAGATVLVTGLGAIGQYAVQVCRLKGARVAASDPVAERRRAASAGGAERVFDPMEKGWEEGAKAFAPGGFDVIIDTSSLAAVVNGLWPLLRRCGKFILQGFYPGTTPLDLNTAAIAMPTIYMPDSIEVPRVRTALEWMHAGLLRSKEIVRAAKPADASKIFEQLADSSDGFIGIAFDWR